MKFFERFREPYRPTYLAPIEPQDDHEGTNGQVVSVFPSADPEEGHTLLTAAATRDTCLVTARETFDLLGSTHGSRLLDDLEQLQKNGDKVSQRLGRIQATLQSIADAVQELWFAHEHLLAETFLHEAITSAHHDIAFRDFDPTEVICAVTHNCIDIITTIGFITKKLRICIQSEDEATLVYMHGALLGISKTIDDNQLEWNANENPDLVTQLQNFRQLLQRQENYQDLPNGHAKGIRVTDNLANIMTVFNRPTFKRLLVEYR